MSGEETRPWLRCCAADAWFCPGLGMGCGSAGQFNHPGNVAALQPRRTDHGQQRSHFAEWRLTSPLISEETWFFS